MVNQEIQLVKMLIVTTVIIFLFITFIFLILLLYKRKQSKTKKDFEFIKLQHEKALLSVQLEIQESTFKKISQEIHDNISLTLTLAKLNLNTLENVDPLTAAQSIDESIDLISKSLNDLNDISKSLDSELIKAHGLIHALETELAIIKRTKQFETEFNVSGDVVFIDADKELILYRIVQEACNNILKHSYARKIDLELKYCTQQICLTIMDDGVGFDENELNKKKRSGLGLNNIRNRAKMINADIKIESVPKIGTSIFLTLPLNNEN
ncbi:sensor histidine kinase [Pollutibacter soli]|uniref:sensor histidine kinase n=1 Tax=Pollutibacter soli TaxID=3034157 RepID=UPI003013A0D9